jgi:hypothetical protein
LQQQNYYYYSYNKKTYTTAMSTEEADDTYHILVGKDGLVALQHAMDLHGDSDDDSVESEDNDNFHSFTAGKSLKSRLSCNSSRSN